LAHAASILPRQTLREHRQLYVEALASLVRGSVPRDPIETAHWIVERFDRTLEAHEARMLDAHGTYDSTQSP
jgi:hypothetical protein